MLKNRIKKMVCIMVVAMSLTCTGATAFAETISFSVTVGGYPEDPLSRQATKGVTNQDASFTGTYFSTDLVGIYVSSYKKTDSTVYTGEAYLSSSNMGKTKNKSYNKTAVAKESYFMRARAASSRVVVGGDYRP